MKPESLHGSRAPGSQSGWLHIWTDGASRGNPGPAGIGARAKDDKGRVLFEVCDYLGETTNNVAEYYALIRILEESRSSACRKVSIHTDSSLMVNQLTGAYRVKSKDLLPLLSRVKSMLAELDDFELEHVPREQNVECDALANRAIDQGLAGVKEPLLESGGGTLF